MKTITSIGCSFTVGTELSDCVSNNQYSRLTWPALIAKKLETNYRCIGLGGCGNLLIADRALEYQARNPNDFLIVNWTFIDRFDYSNHKGRHYNNDLCDYLTTRPGEDDPVSEFYYRHIHSEYRDKLTNLMYIKTVLDQFKKNNTKFFMTCLDDLIWDDRWHSPTHVKELQKEIKPYINWFDGKNFLKWSQCQGFKITAMGHPHDDAHSAAADIMRPKVEAILQNR
jgi:hypothetical protein